jgi:hypothetical protein
MTWAGSSSCSAETTASGFSVSNQKVIRSRVLTRQPLPKPSLPKQAGGSH